LGEVLQAIGKSGRFGMHGYHPDDPDKICNAELILRELDDLQAAIAAVRPDLEMFGTRLDKPA
jgi:hypothetical protein